MQPLPQCFACKHLDRDSVLGVMRCKAFEKIPDAILADEADHREPYAGDGGIRWEAGTDDDGDSFLHPAEYMRAVAEDTDVMP